MRIKTVIPAVLAASALTLGLSGCQNLDSSLPVYADYLITGSSTNMSVALTRPGGVVWSTSGDLTGHDFRYEFTAGEKIVIVVVNSDGQGTVGCDILTGVPVVEIDPHTDPLQASCQGNAS